MVDIRILAGASPVRLNIDRMLTVHVLRVFVNEDREWGNRLGVVLEGERAPESERQRIAAELGFSETVFVEDRATGQMRIYTPRVELPFAGHPCVGTAWLLARQGAPPDLLQTPAGEIGVRHDDGATYISARPGWAPPFEYRRLDSPAEVRAITPPASDDNAYVWAWIDEQAGTIRARSFVPAAGIAEDEATGSAALALCAQLGRPVTIHQGQGSVLLCRPLADGRIEVGGEVALDGPREIPGNVVA
jgi:predicted PhzF superfamily epimerase YddE/YHI9